MNEKMRTKFQSNNPKGRDYLRDIGIDRRITFRWSLREAWCGASFHWLKTGCNA
jgi:hypothetical protein